MPRSELGEDIYAGAFDLELHQPDEYMTMEETPEGPAWHIGTMEQKVRYRSLMQEVPTYVIGEEGPREAMTDLEVELTYGVFKDEVEKIKQGMAAEAFERAAEIPGMTATDISAFMSEYPGYLRERDLSPTEEKAVTALEEEINTGPFEAEAYLPPSFKQIKISPEVGGIRQPINVFEEITDSRSLEDMIRKSRRY